MQFLNFNRADLHSQELLFLNLKVMVDLLLDLVLELQQRALLAGCLVAGRLAMLNLPAKLPTLLLRAHLRPAAPNSEEPPAAKDYRAQLVPGGLQRQFVCYA